MLEHFVITRFNVRLPWLSRYHAESRFNNLEWIRQRIELFDRYCFPSMVSQTSANYTWLVFFDIESPPVLLNAIAKWRRYPPFTPVFTAGLEMSELRKLILRNCHSGVTHVLTTRLDSDDVLGRHFVEDISAAARGQNHVFLNMTRGFCLADARIYTASHESNPFLSLMEPISVLDTVLCVAHDDAAQHAQVVQLKSKRSWMAIIHGGNVANQLEAGAERCPLLMALLDFPVISTALAGRPINQKCEEQLYALKWFGNKIGRVLFPR